MCKTHVPYLSVMKKGIPTEQAAIAVGMARNTLQRWLKTPVIATRLRAPKPILRDGRGVRLWTPSDLKRLAQVKEEIYRKGRGRKKAEQ